MNSSPEWKPFCFETHFYLYSNVSKFEVSKIEVFLLQVLTRATQVTSLVQKRTLRLLRWLSLGNPSSR